MGKRTMQIDVIGPVEGTEFMKCKLYADGRVCVFYMTESNYKALILIKYLFVMVKLLIQQEL